MDLPERLRSTRLDALLAVAFTVLGLVQLAVLPFAPAAAGTLYVVGSTAPLAWRRTFPVEAALVSSVFWLVPLEGYPVLGFVVVVLQFYALGNRGEPGRAVTATTVLAAVLSVVGTLLGPEPAVAAVGGAIVVVAPVVAGRLVRHQQRQNAALVALTRELADERRRSEQAAVEAERVRIARELHDVVGHELTLVAIQAEAAASALRVAPDRAGASVEAIRSTAHRTLTEIRSVLGVLAPEGDGASPSEESLTELADRARAAGIANELRVTGRPAHEQSPAALAVARIVRECLTNAGRHAPGRPVEVRVDWTDGRVDVRAVNPVDVRRPTLPGRGLTGMRHRAELLGGTFTAERVDGCFDVRVSIPA
ncbi:sensor histidine kinase [Nocardioides marmoribigeumensis]|uniref:histidine kinase n=1 Tax=Nocardioides marmoribigeumensis TaxID=433649 RepID=A0ABU2BVG9_9ACTN|nr:histidine kinase [Nocardioides marmoribigeumensis]MDR7362627.1 signal transduction histidine kinase [Nocardioides marmoribigeumensis]